ncbi:MAG: RICIN domain-containing protein [Methanosarcina vacuolata]|jgi:hypothetical protein|nr:RICIN domain-containing protein [Methanosarcina vacuolata]
MEIQIFAKYMKTSVLLLLVLFSLTLTVTVVNAFDPAKSYKIMSLSSGKVMSVAGISHDNGADIHQYEYRNQDNQKWKIIQLSGADKGYYRIVSVNSGKCLEIGGWSTQEGSKANQYQCHNGDNQKFYLVPIKTCNLEYIIKNKNSGMILGVQDNSLENLADIVQYPFVSKVPDNEIWIINAV